MEQIRFTDVFYPMLNIADGGLSPNEVSSLRANNFISKDVHDLAIAVASKHFKKFNYRSTFLTREIVEEIYLAISEMISRKIFETMAQYCSPEKGGKEEQHTFVDALTKFRSAVFEVLNEKYGVLKE